MRIFVGSDSGDSIHVHDDIQGEKDHETFVDLMESETAITKCFRGIKACFDLDDGDMVDDFYKFDGYICATNRGKQFLKDCPHLELLLVDDIDDLPDFWSDEVQVHLLHYLSRVAVDKRSQVTYFEGTNSICDVDELFVLESEVDRYKIFQLQGDPVVNYCTKEFADAFESLGLTGLEFEDVSFPCHLI